MAEEQLAHAENQLELAKLAGARMPADRGLTGLGLLMQLSGSVFLALGAYIAVAPLMQGAGPGGERLQIFVIGVLCAIRSIAHRSAGMALLYGAPKGYLHSLKTYFGISLAQSAAVALVLMNLGTPGKMTILAFVVLMTWPTLVLVMLSRQRYQAMGPELPATEDMGFESAAVLMTIFGLMGTVGAGCVLLSIFKSAGSILTEVPGILWTGVTMMLLARSALHLRAGWQGSSGVDSDKASHSATSYFNFGVVSSVIAGAILMLQMIMDSPGLGFEFFIVVAMTSYLLLIWPTAIRMFFTDRNFSMLLDEGKTHRRAPDTGLTALGWLLLANGAISLVYELGSLLLFRGETAGLSEFAREFSPLQAPSSWISLALAAIQTFAGVQLVRMTDHYRVATTIFGALSVLAIGYYYWPMISKIDLLAELGPFTLATGLGPVFFGLPLAISSIVLVNRDSFDDAKASIAA